ncbi:MAG TPA: M23 family metallopeptidase [Candidatus Eisenbacteria bacterium]|nr:M23 family metallopeptidase [Candidatus Eisenbacteria bacterium]
MHSHVRASTHYLVAFAALAGAVTGVFAFSSGLSANTEHAYAQAAAMPKAEPLVLGSQDGPVAEEPAVAEHLTLSPGLPTPLLPPVADAARRITKKPFGIEIHPETSPVPNDRFNGFHVGVDFETFSDEADAAVPVRAICSGPLLFKVKAKGYGGVAVQGCVIGGEEVSVIYGHLDVESVVAEPGSRLKAGAFVGDLGQGYSEQTDGVRKHLHLGIRKGRTNDIRGYVKDPADMTEFLDARALLGLE